MAEEADFFGDTVPPKLRIPFILRYDNLSNQTFPNFLELYLLICYLALFYKFIVFLPWQQGNNDSEILSPY